jgi:hypothetical protein
MNKVILSTVIACGLLLLDAPEAAAHEDRDSQYRSHRYENSDSYRRDSYRREGYRDRHRGDYRRDYYGSRHNRGKEMPRWLKRNKSFRHWIKHSRLRKNQRLSWNELFDIYRWEHSYNRYYEH